MSPIRDLCTMSTYVSQHHCIIVALAMVMSHPAIYYALSLLAIIEKEVVSYVVVLCYAIFPFSTQPFFLSMEFQPIGSLPSEAMVVSRTVSLSLATGDMIWDLCGLVYLGGNHFVSRYIEHNGTSWYHDGAVTQQTCLRETSDVDLSWAMRRRMTHAIYVMRET